MSTPGVHILWVPRGLVVLQATPTSFAKPPLISNPTTQFYTLLDNVSLFGKDITNPQQSTDSAGQPDVAFGFDSKGSNEFQTVTAEIAKRGELDHGLNAQLLQHFAVALDNELAPFRRSTTSSTRTASPAATAPRSTATSRSPPPRTWRRSCGSVPCRST